MKVVSNSGPLIALAKLGRLNLLAALFERVLISPEVEREIHVGLAQGFEHCRIIIASIDARLIETRRVEEQEIRFERRINLGEVGAIQVALREHADLVLIDDKNARLEAMRLGLRVKGTVGVVLLANQNKILSDAEVIDLLEAIRQMPDIWIDERVIESAIQELKRER